MVGHLLHPAKGVAEELADQPADGQRDGLAGFDPDIEVWVAAHDGTCKIDLSNIFLRLY